jgi:predicted ATPase
MPFSAGDKVGRYEILAPIGVGGMGEVFRAKDLAMLILCTYRDVELEVTRPFAKTLETLLRQKQATRISLRRLPVSGVEAMLAAMSGQTPPPSLARVVFAETEGNPFFVEV